VDTNGDGVVDDNEFRTLAAVVARGKVPVLESDVENLRFNCSEERKLSSGTGPKQGTVGGHSGLHANVYGTYKSVLEISVYPSVREIANCSLVRESIFAMDDWNPRSPTFSIGSEKDVAFEMIGDNATETLRLLDSVRARLSKFICINDNIHNPTPELDAVVKQFFVAMYPVASAFELTSPAVEGGSGSRSGKVQMEDERNPTLYLDEYRANYASWRYHFSRQFYRARHAIVQFRSGCMDLVRSLAVGMLRMVNEQEDDAAADRRLEKERLAAQTRLVHGEFVASSSNGHSRRRMLAAESAPSAQVPFAHILYRVAARLLNSGSDGQIDLATGESVVCLALLTAIIGLLACVATSVIRRGLGRASTNRLAQLDETEGGAHNDSYKEYQNNLIDAALELEGVDQNSSAFNRRLALAAAREKASSGSASSSLAASPVAPSSEGSGGDGDGDGSGVVRKRVYADWNMKTNEFSQSEIEQSVQEGLEMARLHRLEMMREAELEAAAASINGKGGGSSGSGSGAFPDASSGAGPGGEGTRITDPLNDIWKKVGHTGRRTSGAIHPVSPTPCELPGESADPLNDIWKKAGYGLKQSGSSTGSVSPAPASPVASPLATPKGSSANLAYSNSADYLSKKVDGSGSGSGSTDSLDIPVQVLTQAEVDGALFLEHVRRKKRIEEEDEAADRLAMGIAAGTRTGAGVGILMAPTPDGASNAHRGLSKGVGPAAKRKVGFVLSRNTIDGMPARPVVHALGNMVVSGHVCYAGLCYICH